MVEFDSLVDAVCSVADRVDRIYVVSPSLKPSEVMKMVERTEAQGFDEFTGLVEDVVYEEPNKEGMQPQYHIVIAPQDVEVKGKTGKMHEWIRIPETSTENTVPQGSIVDYYITSIERLDKAVKAIKTIKEVFDWMQGKQFRFNKETPGKAFGGKPAASYWIPVQLIK